MVGKPDRPSTPISLANCSWDNFAFNLNLLKGEFVSCVLSLLGLELTRYWLIFKPRNDKSQFLAQAGFTLDNWQALETAIRELILTSLFASA